MYKILLFLGVCALVALAQGLLSTDLNPEGKNKIQDAHSGQRGFYIHNGKIYYFDGEESKVTWSEAVNICNAENMRLISLNSEEKHLEFRDLVFNILPPAMTHTFFWTSGIYVKHYGFLWSGTGERFTYSAWGLSEPDNRYIACDAVSFYNYPSEAVWWDGACSNLDLVVCEEL